MTTPGMSQVDTIAMKTALGHFQHHYAVQNKNRDQIQDELLALRAAYTGDTSGQLQASLETWVGHFNNIIHQLGTMVEALGGNADAYTKGDEVNRTIAANPMPGLAGL